MRLHEGEPFKKVYGPVFAYLNSVSGVHGSEQVLWSDAVLQVLQLTTLKYHIKDVLILEVNVIDDFFLFT